MQLVFVRKILDCQNFVRVVWKLLNPSRYRRQWRVGAGFLPKKRSVCIRSDPDSGRFKISFLISGRNWSRVKFALFIYQPSKKLSSCVYFLLEIVAGAGGWAIYLEQTSAAVHLLQPQGLLSKLYTYRSDVTYQYLAAYRYRILSFLAAINVHGETCTLYYTGRHLPFSSRFIYPISC